MTKHARKGRKASKQAEAAGGATVQATGGPDGRRSADLGPDAADQAQKDIKESQGRPSSPGGGERISTADGGGTLLIHSRKKCDKGGIAETDLARRMGIAREYLRGLRKKFLTEGTHWSFSGRSVILREMGVEEILRHIGVEPGEVPPEKPPLLVEVAKVWANPNLLGCVRVNAETAEDAKIINVWVRNTQLFRKGQQIPVKRLRGRWVLAMRQPRTKGRLK